MLEELNGTQPSGLMSYTWARCSGTVPLMCWRTEKGIFRQVSFTCCRCSSWFNELRYSWFYFLRLSSTAGCSCSLSHGPQSSRRFNLWDANTSRGWCNISVEHKRAAVLLVTDDGVKRKNFCLKLNKSFFFLPLLCLGCSVFSADVWMVGAKFILKQGYHVINYRWVTK